MQAGLTEIKQVPEVFGCMLVSNRGEVIEADPPLEFTEEELESIGGAVIQVLLGLETWGSPAGELDFYYQRSRLIVRDLDRTALVMICSPDVDPALLRLTVNVVARRWEGDPDAQEVLQSYPAEREVELPDLFGGDETNETSGPENRP